MRDAALAEMAEANRRLEQMIAELRREKFGPRSEKLSPDQYNLPLEDVEIAQGVLQAAQKKADATRERRRARRASGSSGIANLCRPACRRSSA